MWSLFCPLLFYWYFDFVDFNILGRRGNVPKMPANPFILNPPSSSSFCRSVINQLSVLSRVLRLSCTRHVLVSLLSASSTYCSTSTNYVGVPESNTPSRYHYSNSAPQPPDSCVLSCTLVSHDRFLKKAGDEVAILTTDDKEHAPDSHLDFPVVTTAGFRFILYKQVRCGHYIGGPSICSAGMCNQYVMCNSRHTLTIAATINSVLLYICTTVLLFLTLPLLAVPVCGKQCHRHYEFSGNRRYSTGTVQVEGPLLYRYRY